MEYVFSRDTVGGGFHASFSFEHEAFATWLIDEVGSDTVQIDVLLAAVEEAKRHANRELQFPGREYLLTMGEQDVILRLNASCEGPGSAVESGDDEEFSVNNDNFSAACGLDDFADMLNAWKVFVRR